MKGPERRSGNPVPCAQRLARVAMTPAFAKPAKVPEQYMKMWSGYKWVDWLAK
jgi:hypothetical protein